jgi:deoxyribodipyrimidine photolyase-related protein
LYWDFLWRHRERFARHPRLGAQIRNVERLDAAEVEAIQQQAERIRLRYREARSIAIHPTQPA